MTNSKSKIIISVASVLVVLALIFIALNSAYFFKQIGFFLHKPNVAQDQNAVGSGSGDKIGEPNQLNIPSLGITAPIVEPSESNEKSFQEALKNGPTHYPGTAAVGELGNAYIFGHSSDFAFKGGSYKTVFALLPHIEKAAQIFASNSAGQIFTYEVTDSFVASSSDVQLLDQHEHKEKLLTLQTSYPVGTALKRWIVIAKLKE